jgi:hypothetical protein
VTSQVDFYWNNLEVWPLALKILERLMKKMMKRRRRRKDPHRQGK